jgi:hypothetical protein
MAQLLNDLNEWKQMIYTHIADLIKEVEDGLNLNNEDLSNNQNFTSFGAEQTSNVETTTKTICLTSDDHESIQRTKVNGLIDQYERFTIEENESIEEMSTRFQALTSKLEDLNKKLSMKELVSKMLRSLSLNWNQIATTIEET